MTGLRRQVQVDDLETKQEAEAAMVKKTVANLLIDTLVAAGVIAAQIPSNEKRVRKWL